MHPQNSQEVPYATTTISSVLTQDYKIIYNAKIIGFLRSDLSTTCQFQYFVHTSKLQ